MKVTLPFPPAALFPNRAAGKHWSATRQAKDEYRDGAFYLTKQEMRAANWKPLVADVALSLIFIQPDLRPRDVDNMLAAAKHAIDGFALALGMNDRQFNPIRIFREQGKKPGAVILEVSA